MRSLQVQGRRSEKRMAKGAQLKTLDDIARTSDINISDLDIWNTE